jgi:hypothetical protein
VPLFLRDYLHRKRFLANLHVRDTDVVEPETPDLKLLRLSAPFSLQQFQRELHLVELLLVLNFQLKDWTYPVFICKMAS